MTFRLGGAATDDEECLEATVATDGGQVVGQQQWLIGRVDPGTRPLRTARDEDDHPCVVSPIGTRFHCCAHAAQHYGGVRRLAIVTDPVVPERTDSGYRSPILNRPGAVNQADTSPDVGVPYHYGDPFGEQRAADSAPVVVDRSHRDVLTIGGGERLTWLEGFVSQHVSEIPDGGGAETLVLDANGRVEHHAVLADVAGTLVVDTEPGRGADLLQFLTKMVFWADVTIEAADLAVLSLLGPALADTPVLDALRLGSLPAESTAVPLPGGGFARRLPADGLGIEVTVADARAGLVDAPAASADLVVLDVFAGARIPAHLTSTDFLAAVDRVLAPGGVHAANLADGGALDLRALVREQLDELYRTLSTHPMVKVVL